MAMKKTGDAEKAEVVYSGAEAEVVRDHLVRTGKALSDFDDAEKKQLDRDLKVARNDLEKEDEKSE